MNILETRLAVSKVQDTKAKDNSVRVTLEGTKILALQTPTGYKYEDTAEITVTIKVGSMITAKQLGINKYGTTKVIELRDQDHRLDSFEASVEPALPECMQKSVEVKVSPPLDAYRGIVPDEALDKIESAVPAHILKEIA